MVFGRSTPTVEPVIAGTQPMLPQARFLTETCVRNRFTPRHFFNRHRCTCCKSVCMSAQVVHSARNSNFSTCVTLCKLRFESRSICARHRYYLLGFMGAIPPLGTGHFRKKENDGPSEESQPFDATSLNAMRSCIGVTSQRCTKRLPTLWVRSGSRVAQASCRSRPRVTFFLMLHECWLPGCFGRGRVRFRGRRLPVASHGRCCASRTRCPN